ncbi:MAG TPA: hypothetical protein PKD85_00360 [Saprospiraceae bacterium]|nr:hypothetical protein [Saprospiraceae bacterium]
MKDKAYYLIFVLGTLMVVACNKTKEERTLLYEQERVIYDSLYTAALEVTKAEIDSICKVQREELYQIAVDSIYEIRLEEIENLLENGR